METTNAVKVLDKGYVALVETWGSDARIIEAARMSTDGGFRGWGPMDCPACTWLGLEQGEKCRKCGDTGAVPGDEKLLRYLWTHKHATPFEMAGMTIEVKAPIFVFREWHRHRTQSYNEMSARYGPLPNDNYLPTLERCMPAQTTNKQAQGSGRTPTVDEVVAWLDRLQRVYDEAQSVYQDGLDLGIPKEIARCPVPVARYSKMRASANLRNWLQFLTLRMDLAAQWEIRVCAKEVGGFIAKTFPRTWGLFIEGSDEK